MHLNREATIMRTNTNVTIFIGTLNFDNIKKYIYFENKFIKNFNGSRIKNQSSQNVN